jgi:hypothetical protein
MGAIVIQDQMEILVLRHVPVNQLEEFLEFGGSMAPGEFRKKLFGWTQEHRFIVVRERLSDKPSAGRRLFDILEYTFRVFVTSRSDAPEEIWREYNQRVDIENRITELKYDLGADNFYLQEFFTTEAVFRAMLPPFNLLSDFQQAIGMNKYRRPAIL